MGRWGGVRLPWSHFVASAAALGMTAWPATRAQASEPNRPVAIEWRAPENCPSTADVELDVARLLAGASVGEGPRLFARAEVTHPAVGPWHVELTTTSRSVVGHRSVSAETCLALAHATGLIVALAVDPEQVAKNRQLDRAQSDSSMDLIGDPWLPSPTADAVASPAGTLTSDVRRADAPAANTTTSAGAAIKAADTILALRRSSEPAGFEVEAVALADLGTLPSLGSGAGVRVAVIPPFAPVVRFELGAAAWLSQISQPALPFPGTLGLRTLDTAVCVLKILAAWEIGACEGAELAWLVQQGATPSGIGAKYPAALWPLLRPRVTLAYRLSSVWVIRGDWGIGIEPNSPEISWNSPGCTGCVFWRPAEVTQRAAVGLALHF